MNTLRVWGLGKQQTGLYCPPTFTAAFVIGGGLYQFLEQVATIFTGIYLLKDNSQGGETDDLLDFYLGRCRQQSGPYLWKC